MNTSVEGNAHTAYTRTTTIRDKTFRATDLWEFCNLEHSVIDLNKKELQISQSSKFTTENFVSAENLNYMHIYIYAHTHIYGERQRQQDFLLDELVKYFMYVAMNHIF